MLRRKNDILWKGLLEGVFDDLLRFLFKNADTIFDLKKGFDFLDKELGEMYPEPGKSTETRFVDKLVKVYLLDGTDQWVLVHIEVQGETDPRFAERMFKYYCRIFDRYNRPITGVAIFTGKNARKMPNKYERSFCGSTIRYEYNAIYLSEYAESDLLNSSNPFGLVLLAARTELDRNVPERELYARARSVIRLLLGSGIGREKVNAILHFIKNYIRFADHETNRTFNMEIDSVTNKTTSMNIYEQVIELRVEEAREDARRSVVEKLLIINKLSIDEIATVVDETPEFVDTIRKEIKN